MVFSSYEYIFFFLPITFFVYFYLNKMRLVKLGQVFLVASSLFFYAWWKIEYLPILLTSIIFNFFAGKYLTESNDWQLTKRKCLLIAGVAGNILLHTSYIQWYHLCKLLKKKGFTELRICYEQKIKSLESTTYRHETIEWEWKNNF